MNAIFYPAIFHPEESGYSVEIPDIEGCFTQGDTMDEAVRMAKDAIGLMLEDCKVCPEPSVPSALHVDPEKLMCADSAASLSQPGMERVFFTDLYRFSYSSISKGTINFSGVLQDALKEKLHLA